MSFLSGAEGFEKKRDMGPDWPALYKVVRIEFESLVDSHALVDQYV